MVQLFTRFRMIYNISYIFTLEHREPFRNIVTRFSQLHFFRIFCRLRNIFPDHHSMDFTDFFFIRKIKHFSRNCRNRFLKYVFDVEIYENLRKSSKEFFVILRLKRSLYLNENEFQKSVPTISR